MNLIKREGDCYNDDAIIYCFVSILLGNFALVMIELFIVLFSMRLEM